MKKLFAMLAALMFVAAAGLYADKAAEGMQGQCGGMGMMMPGAEFKAEKTAAGADMIITARDKKDAAALQMKAEEMVKWHKDAAAKGSPMMGMCPCGVKGADTKMEKTADGVKMIITAKDPKAVAEIQEKAAAMAEMQSRMGEGMTQKGMMGHGMGMEGWQSHMQKKLGIAFKFMIVIWSLLIILIASTIVLVIKTIIKK